MQYFETLLEHYTFLLENIPLLSDEPKLLEIAVPLCTKIYKPASPVNIENSTIKEISDYTYFMDKVSNLALSIFDVPNNNSGQMYNFYSLYVELVTYIDNEQKEFREKRTYLLLMARHERDGLLGNVLDNKKPVTQNLNSVRMTYVYNSSYILKIIRHACRTWEENPKTYSRHNEVELRNILLSHFNSEFIDLASGETQRKDGRADIIIRLPNRVSFVAECKVWRNPGKIKEGIDQLLKYLTWRDSETALIVFNKDRPDFSNILVKIFNEFKNHPKMIREIKNTNKGEGSFLFCHPDDAKTHFFIHAFAFNIYSQ